MIDLNPNHLQTVKRLLAGHVPECEVRAFGSRVTWTAKDYSDLDLAVVGEQSLDPDVLRRLKEAFEESELPFRVDVLDWHAISASFRKVIEGQIEVVQKGKQKSWGMAGEWRDVALGEVIELKRGYDLPQKERIPGRVPLVSSSGVTDHQAVAMAKGPGVVTGRYGTLGQVFYIPEDYWPLNTTLYVRDFKGNDPRFISYFLRTLNFLAYSDKAAVPGLNRNHLHQAMVRLPADVQEQRAIAHILGTLDDKIELNRRMNETLEAMARALFQSWFVDFDPVRAKAEGRDPGLPQPLADLFPDAFQDSGLGEIPRGWRVGTLGELSDRPQYGFTASAAKDPVGPKFLRITDINKVPWIDWSSVPYCKATNHESEQYRIRSGDILIARMADPGHGVMIEQDVEAVFASYLIRFRPSHSAFARFLQCWLKSDGYWWLVGGRKAGTTRASLNAQVLAGFQLIVPPVPVCEAFTRKVEVLRSKVVANVAESNILSALRDTLLPKLLSGEVQVVPPD